MQATNTEPAADEQTAGTKRPKLEGENEAVNGAKVAAAGQDQAAENKENVLGN